MAFFQKTVRSVKTLLIAQRISGFYVSVIMPWLWYFNPSDQPGDFHLASSNFDSSPDSSWSVKISIFVFIDTYRTKFMNYVTFYVIIHENGEVDELRA